MVALSEKMYPSTEPQKAMDTSSTSTAGGEAAAKSGSPGSSRVSPTGDINSSPSPTPTDGGASSTDSKNANDTDDVKPHRSKRGSPESMEVIGDSSSASVPPKASLESASRNATLADDPTQKQAELEATQAVSALGSHVDHVSSYESLEGTFKADRLRTDNALASRSEQRARKPRAASVDQAMASDSPPKEIIAHTPLSGSLATSSTRKAGGGLRRGKWTVEEEAYVARVIQDFNSGYLDAPAGTTLRTYLSEKLQCDPMRITKKFTGDACIGKRVFHPAVRSPSNAAAIDKAQAELDGLERRWRRRLEMQQRESAKKAAASAAAAAVSSGHGSEGGLPVLAPRPTSEADIQRSVVTQTASWLDRAKSVLKEPSLGDVVHHQGDDLHSQMQEVERLIHEGPTIQQTSANLSTMLDAPGHEEHDLTGQHDVEPADKRMRTAEDAEALVGFLRSVRASAASGQDM